jgi:hypothetical protein
MGGCEGARHLSNRESWCDTLLDVLGFSTGFFTVSTPGFSKFTPGFTGIFIRFFSLASSSLSFLQVEDL